MNYNKPLPKPEDLNRFANAVDTFPISVQRTVNIARTLGYKNDLIEFLKLFSGEFESRADLYARTTELVLLIREENKQPGEGMLSQQD
ncbi:MAG TPA: hypothetical protein VFK11_03260 [Candidatus Saccharimonadales bacterium]|nr:hypothetical protein [Candidatus Saccharimonadales bacterium]